MKPGAKLDPETAMSLVTLWSVAALLEIVGTGMCVYERMYVWAFIDAALTLYAISRADAARKAMNDDSGRA